MKIDSEVMATKYNEYTQESCCCKLVDCLS